MYRPGAPAWPETESLLWPWTKSLSAPCMLPLHVQSPVWHLSSTSLIGHGTSLNSWPISFWWDIFQYIHHWGFMAFKGQPSENVFICFTWFFFLITELSGKHSLLKYVLLDLHVAQEKLHSPHLAPHPQDNINCGLDSALIKWTVWYISLSPTNKTIE